MSNETPDYAKIFRDHYIFGRDDGLYQQLFGKHARRKGPRFDQMRAFNKLAFSMFGEILQGEKAIYREGAISKGMRAHYHAKKNGPFMVEQRDGTTRMGYDVFDLDEKIGSQIFLAEVIQPNTRTQIEGLSYLRSAYPERPVIVPIFLQGATFMAGQPNFDRGSKRKDKDYMVLWGAVVNEFVDMLPVMGDWPFTAMTNVEISLGLEIAAGRVARRPKADMDFRDVNDNYVSLFDIAVKRFEYLKWAADNKFNLHIEPTLLARDCALASMGVCGMLPGANKRFLEGIINRQDDMDDLQRAGEALLLEQVREKRFDVDPAVFAQIHPAFASALEEAKKGKIARRSIVMPSRVGGFHIRQFADEDLRHGIYDAAETEALRERSFMLDAPAVYSPAMREVDLSGKILERHDGRSLFSRVVLPDLTERETMQAKFMLGVAESVMLPAKRTVFLVADDKYGPHLDEQPEAAQMAYDDEGPNVMGKNFARAVREPHRLLIAEAQKQLKKIGHTVSSADLQRIFILFQMLPEFAVAPGEAMPGSAARLLARQSYIARNCTDVSFKTGMWEQSNDGVQDMVMATRLQLGLESAAQGDTRTKRVFADNGKPLSLADRAMAIWPHLEKALEAGRDARDLVEPATAIAQLWGMHRLINDHPLSAHVFSGLREQGIVTPTGQNWHNIPLHATAYDAPAFEKKWHDDIKPIIEARLAPAIRLRHLDMIDDFAEIKRRQDASQKIIMMGERPTATRLVKKGGVTSVKEGWRYTA